MPPIISGGWEVFHGKVRGKGPAPKLSFGPKRTYWHLPPYWPRVVPPADFCLDDISTRRKFRGSAEYAKTMFTFRHPSIPQYAALESKLKALKSHTVEAAVKMLFLEGLPASLARNTRVVRVDSIINKSAFRIYDAMRASSEKRLGKSRTREAWLWHGTGEENIAKICTNGFDRSFGKVNFISKLAKILIYNYYSYSRLTFTTRSPCTVMEYILREIRVTQRVLVIRSQTKLGCNE